MHFVYITLTALFSFILANCHNLTQVGRSVKPTKPYSDKHTSIAPHRACLCVPSGHQVTLLQQNGQWYGQVSQFMPHGASRQLILPVRGNDGLTVESFLTYRPDWQRQKTHIYFPEADPKGGGFVYLGFQGLKGGTIKVSTYRIEIDKEKYPVLWASYEGYSGSLRGCSFGSLNQRLGGFSALGLACQEGNWGCVQALLAYDSVDPNDPSGSNGQTPLHVACFFDHIGCVQTLLKDPRVDVNRTREDGLAAIHFACEEKNIKSLDCLLQHPDLKVNQVDKQGLTALYRICLEQDVDVTIVKALLGHPAIDVNKQAPDGCTPLYVACQKGHAGCVKELLKDPDIKLNIGCGQYGHPALYIACAQNNIDCIRLLVKDKRLNINYASPDGSTVLHLAAQYSNFESTQELLKHPDIKINQRDAKDYTALCTGCLKGNAGFVKALLARADLDINAWCKEGWTALGAACYYNHLDCLRLLVAHKTLNVNYAFGVGPTALHVAVMQNHPDSIRELLKHPKLDLHKPYSTCKVSAIQLAQVLGKQECLLLLLADPRSKATDEKDLPPAASYQELITQIRQYLANTYQPLSIGAIIRARHLLAQIETYKVKMKEDYRVIKRVFVIEEEDFKLITEKAKEYKYNLQELRRFRGVLERMLSEGEKNDSSDEENLLSRKEKKKLGEDLEETIQWVLDTATLEGIFLVVGSLQAACLAPYATGIGLLLYSTRGSQQVFKVTESIWSSRQLQKIVAKFGGRVVEKGMEGAINVEGYTITRTVANKIAERPYINSPSMIKNIIESGKGIPDAYFKGGLNYKVPGTFNGSQGIFELGINPETKMIYHFLFNGSKKVR